MNSSGIKRGVAIAAVSALAIGTPVAVYAATDGDAAVYAISQSADSTSLPQLAYATIDGKATAKGGAYLYTNGGDTNAGDQTAHPGALTVTVSETFAKGATIPAATDKLFSIDGNSDGDADPTTGTVDSVTFSGAGATGVTYYNTANSGGTTNVANLDTDSDGTFDTDTKVTFSSTTPFQGDAGKPSDGSFEYLVAAGQPGTVTATTGDASVGGTASTSLTIGKVQSGESKVAQLLVTPASVNQYAGADAPKYTVTPVDANGVPVAGVTVKVQRNSESVDTEDYVDEDTHPTGEQHTPALASADWGWNGELTYQIPNSAANATNKSATDTITFFVESVTSPNTNKVDPQDVSKTVTATFTDESDLHIWNADNADASYVTFEAKKLPDDNTDVSLPVDVYLADSRGDHAPVANVNVVVTLTGPAAANIKPITVTTGADGTAKATFTVPKAVVATDPTLGVTATVGGTNIRPTVTAANAPDDYVSNTVSFEKRHIFVSYAGSKYDGTQQATAQAQAVAGGTVSLPIVVADQFGKPAANVTLAYDIVQGAGIHDRGNETEASLPLTTDANGKATITYTDEAKNGATSADTDIVEVENAFGNLYDATGNGFVEGSLNIEVTYLAALTADADKSVYSDNVNLGLAGNDANNDQVPDSLEGLAANSETLKDADDTTGVPGQGVVVGFNSLGLPTTSYEVKAVSTEGVALTNQPVTFTATGSATSILVDPTTIDPNKGITEDSTYGLGTVTVNTNAAGIAAVTVTSLSTGDVSVKAASGNFSHTFKTVRYEPDAAWNISLDSQPTSVEPGSSVKYIYNVTDEFGNPVYGFGDDGLLTDYATGLPTTTDDPANGKAATNPFFGYGFSIDPEIATATDPGQVYLNSGVDKNSQFSVVLQTLDSDQGDGSFTVTPTGRSYVPDSVKGGYWSDDAAAAFVKKFASNAQLAALIKPYVGKDGVTTEFTVGTTTTKTDPTLKVTAKSKVTFTKKHGKRIRHNWDVLTVHTNAPAGTAVKVGAKTHKVKANGKVGVFKFADKAPKKFHTYKVTVTASDTTNAKTVSKKVK